MKKIFTFALALIACATAFTSCEKKIDSPLVGSWNARGTLLVVDPATGSEQYYAVLRTFNFIDNGTFLYADYIYNDGYATNDGYITEGSWSVDGDKLTLKKEKYGTTHNGSNTYDKNFKPVEELIKWRIEGHYLYLVRNFGTENEREESFYDGSGLD